MRTFRALSSLALVLALASPALAAGEDLLKFNAFQGIPQGGVNINDIPGGGRPWTIISGKAKLETDGTFKVEVVGLVLALDGLPREGTNPFAEFVATLSCRNADGTLNNITTRPFPATLTGESKIRDTIPVPATCLAPVVFVRGFNGTTNPWFAVTGF